MDRFKPQLEPIKRSTLTVEEVAEYLGISTDMVYKMVREKALVHFRIGRRILFKRDAIDKQIEKQMQVVMEDGQ